MLSTCSNPPRLTVHQLSPISIFQHQCLGEMWTELFTLRPWKKEKRVTFQRPYLSQISTDFKKRCTLSQTSIQKSQFSFVQKLVGISSKDGLERVSCMISSNMNKNKRLLYILFPLSSLIPLPLPLCSSKLDHPSPSSSSQ